MRGGDLHGTTQFPWPRATCSNTFLRAARRAIASESLLGHFESAGSCTTRSVAAAHGNRMGMMPLVGIIRNVDYHRDGVVMRGYTEIGLANIRYTETKVKKSMFSQCKVDKHKFTSKQVDKKRCIIQEGKSKVKLV